MILFRVRVIADDGMAQGSDACATLIFVEGIGDVAI